MARRPSVHAEDDRPPACCDIVERHAIHFRPLVRECSHVLLLRLRIVSEERPGHRDLKGERPAASPGARQLSTKYWTRGMRPLDVQVRFNLERGLIGMTD